MVPGNNMRKVRRLKRKFYDRDPREVSRDLLGKLLVRNESNQVISGRIVEVEAYLSDDPAAHSAAGRTARRRRRRPNGKQPKKPAFLRD